MHVDIVPLAITMMAGPQILTAIILVTSERAITASLAYIGAVVAASTAVLALLTVILGALGEKTSLSDSSGAPSTRSIVVQYVLVGLLILLAIKNYRQRETVQAPKWLKTMQTAGPKLAFTTGFTLIALMPTDLIAMVTVATNLESNKLAFIDAAPFLLLTWLIAALPLIGYLLFRKRAVVAMPQLRDWMQNNSWLVNIAMCVLFAFLILD